MLLLSTYLLFFSMPVYTKCDNDGRALCTGQFNYPKQTLSVVSVFMSLFSPLKSDKLDHYVPEDTEINSLESQIVRKRQAKTTMASGRKTPLQPSLKVVQRTL
ncbi:calmodulin-binding protein Sha1 [Aspergillus fumigatus Z5]|nr:calmodulin-binding protein Sha1 [Aspergillus fumigatus Z5]